MNDRSSEHRSRTASAAARRDRVRSADCLDAAGIGTTERHEVNQVTVERVDPCERGVTQGSRIHRYCLKHRLHIALRLADRAQDLARRGLLLEPFLQFCEQTRVLDRNDSLVSEGLE
jgi:hypothetical protein